MSGRYRCSDCKRAFRMRLVKGVLSDPSGERLPRAPGPCPHCGGVVLPETYEALKAIVNDLPPMSERSRRHQALDWAYGNLACSTNHKPQLDAFRKVALGNGWASEEFEEWAKTREWADAAPTV